MAETDFLIVGLGNPGTCYAQTRHNLGFMIVEALSNKQGLSFKREWRIKGRIARGTFEEKKVYLLLPSTYMNLSGVAVKKCIAYYQLSLQNVLIVVDDIYLKLGAMRLRAKGSAGGHNGLKSIESHLQTQEFSRLRIGVGEESLPERALEEYVLSPFTAQEKQTLPDVIEAGAAVTLCWLAQGTEAAAQLAADLTKRLSL